MTFSPTDIDLACEKAAEVEAIADKQLSFYQSSSIVQKITDMSIGAVGSLLRFTGVMSSSTEEEELPPNGEVRALVCKAESNILCAVLLIVQESILSYMKAGLKINKCKLFDWSSVIP